MSDPKIPIAQIERQLRRMVESGLFRAHAQKAKFLEFIVTKTLGKEDFVEKDIRAQVFPGEDYEAESNLVRITKNQLRDLIKEYYGSTGLFDPILISIPEQPEDAKGRHLKFAKGQAYKPEFQNNPTHLGGQLKCTGNALLREATPSALDHARDLFGYLNMIQPGCRESSLGKAEAALISSLYRAATRSPKDYFQDSAKALVDIGMPGPHHFEALRSIMNASQLKASIESDDFIAERDKTGWPKPDSAHWCCIRGAHFLCACGYRTAAKWFMEGVKLDLVYTVSSRWFLLFLFIIRKPDPAILLLKYQADEALDDPLIQGAYALALYATRGFEEAKERLVETFKIEPNSWFVRLVACLVCIALKEGDDALSHYRRMLFLMECGPFEFMPGLGVIAGNLAKGITEDERIKNDSAARDVVLTGNKRQDWLQFALIHLCRRDFDTSVAALESAWNDYDPLIHLIYILPIFDPLREHPDFKFLVEFIAKRTEVDFPFEINLP